MERRDLRTNGGKPRREDSACWEGGVLSHLTFIDCSVELLLPQLPKPPATPAELGRRVAALVQYGANVGRAEEEIRI